VGGGGYLEYITTLVPFIAAALKLIAALYVYLAGVPYILHFYVILMNLLNIVETNVEF